MEKKSTCALTIAGSDSGGGAGIEADLKTFSALNIFGTCAITAVTAQNTKGVYEIFPLPPKIVERQIEVVLEDTPIRFAKTGMLYSKGIMEVVAECVKSYGLDVVVDPVFRAGSGDLLIHERDKKFLIEFFVPNAMVLTPNRYEAEDIAGMKIKTVEDMKKVAKRIADFGVKAVVVKGGHVEGDNVTDVLYCEGEFKTFTKPRVEVKPHGGGCVFSAAITSFLAMGHGIVESVTKAEQFMQDAIAFASPVGKGRIPVNPMAYLFNEAEKIQVVQNVSAAVRMVEEHGEFLPFIPEVGMQIAMALPYASSKGHVAAVEGRIVRFREKAKAVGCVDFGVSEHISRVVLTALKYDKRMRAALNLRYHSDLVNAFKHIGCLVSSFDRKLEPLEIKMVEGSTLSWGVGEAIKAEGKVPDVIYDLGDVGKEPMIRVLGFSAMNVVEKTLSAIRQMKRK
jgi:hydroxymethylpyrimidine/phosphomethylpyrimidine kinase